MQFDSPDVEKDFPGLYASESGKKSNESDFSDDGHERLSKKDLLIGKRKDKKDSKKDRGYAALEGESSPEEDSEMKSPSKSKKSKSFKFPSKKEKREKSREKDGKEKEKEKECDKEKKKDKDVKGKLKLKERKKSKHEDCVDGDEQPVFGVSLQVAVERSRCHDGVDIPLVVRNCIDYVQECGLNMENIYKLSGIKSKVQHLRRQYNQREAVRLADYEPPVVTSLLKQFLRELPEPVLTNELLARFEEAAAVKEVAQREAELKALVDQLPTCHRHLLAWLIAHLDRVTTYEKVNKMNAQNIAITLSPVLLMSHRLLTALLCHCQALFPDVSLKKYVPPLSAGSPSLPDTAEGIEEELRKQESLLNQIHREMNAGFVSKEKEEQLWEVQRIITQLKRKLRTVQRAREMSQVQKSVDESHQANEEEFHMDLTLQKARSCSEEEAPVGRREPDPVPEPQDTPSPKPTALVEAEVEEPEVVPSTSTDVDTGAGGAPEGAAGNEEELQSLLQEETALQLEQRELLSLQSDLRGRVREERAEIERLRAELASARDKYSYRDQNDCSSEGSSSASHSEPSDADDPEVTTRIEELKRENQQLQKEKTNLVRRIMEEREACLHLRVQLSLIQLSQESKQL
ncbi:ralA-binding protein 1 [Bacillus rossius redtenbacheri]|uniref:ralA-binding protein 1 n=1 Tax=Bacillus rossius redtenbacheri TaxID=93214 RepID=UPI002FDE08CC